MANIERGPKDTVAGGLEEVETEQRGLPFALSKTELKLLGIAGVGFFLDAYDLFIINQVATLLQYRLYGGHALPATLGGVMKAGANIGAVIGQFSFGYLADYLGRKAVYGKELMIIIFGTIMTIAAPTNKLSPSGVLGWITAFRIIQGIGIGADYPMSASVMADRARIYKRGALLGYIFANQGWGSLVGSLVTMIVLAIYHHAIDHKVSAVDGVWRIIVAVSLIPAFGTLYQRLTLAESRRYKASKALEQGVAMESDDALHKEKTGKEGSHSGDESPKEVAQNTQTLEPKKASWDEALIYFGEWRHLKNLMGCAMSWFLLDIAFYGINLNTNVVLQAIGFGGTTGTPYHKIFAVATGNLIVTVLGFVPGYYVSILVIEYTGRKSIQLMGFIMAGLFLSILAGKFHELTHTGFIVLFTFLQFFFNFGANFTTFLYPAEIFPTRVRGFAHGICAGSGKAGAIITALVFSIANTKIGTAKTLWILAACSFAGIPFTLLLPEVKGRDPDEVDRQEIEEKRRAQHTV